MSHVCKRSQYQVLGCLMKNPNLMNETKTPLDREDFPEAFHKIIFAGISNLHADGVQNIDYITVDNFLSNYDKQYKVFTDNNGMDYLVNAVENSDLGNFHYNYNRVKKFSVLRMAVMEEGINVDDIYDDTIISPAKQEEMQERFDSMSLQDLIVEIEKKTMRIKDKFMASVNNQGQHAGDGLRDLKESLKLEPEIGSPLCGKIFNTIFRGARLKKLYLRSAPTGVGKAIPNDTLIPTPKGLRKVGDIEQGDFVFGQDGKPTKVLQIHPQGESKEIWEVTFADGRKAKCCSEHLWEYRYDSHRTKEYRVETIEEIYNRTTKLKNGLKDSDNRGYRFHIRMNEPVEYQEKEFSVDPYVMGLSLGDGSFRYDKTNKSFNFSSETEELVGSIARLLNCDFKKNSQYNFGHVFKPKNNPSKNLSVEEIFKDYPELWNKKSEDKFIPSDYMQGSIGQRLSLLQGLLDSDGGIDEKGRVSFTTTSPHLRDQIILLANSLGMIGGYSIDKRVEKYSTGECYNVKLQAKKEMKPKMFRLERKLKIAERYANSTKREEYKDHLAIVSIKPTKETVDMTCFTVDNKDSLFLMNDYIVTHNTRLSLGDSMNLAVNEIYDTDRKRWVSNGVSEPTLFITTELEMDEIQTPMIAFVSAVDEDKILDGLYTAEEEARVDRAIEIIERSPIHIEYLPDFDIAEVERTIQKNVINNGVKFIFFDREIL